MNAAFVPTLSLRATSFCTRPAAVSPTASPSNVTKAVFGSGRPGGRRFRAPGGGGGGNFGTGKGSGGGGNAGTGGGRDAAGGGGGSLFSGGSNPFQSVYGWYGAQVAKRALVTKALTSFIGFSVATLLTGDGGDEAWSKAVQVGLMGALVHGVGGHYYYGKMEGLLPGQGGVEVVGKTVVDFLAFLPLIGVAFAGIDSVVKGGSLGDSFDKAKDAWKIPAPIWVMWSGLSNFVAPMPERVLFYNGVVLLSAATHKLANKAKED